MVPVKKKAMLLEFMCLSGDLEAKLVCAFLIISRWKNAIIISSYRVVVGLLVTLLTGKDAEKW